MQRVIKTYGIRTDYRDHQAYSEFARRNFEAVARFVVPGSQWFGNPKFEVKYDPAAAKKLLAEAGYPDGFSLTYSCFIPIKHICEAISNDLLKIGVKAQVEPVTINLFRKKQADGELNMTSIFYPSAGHPDAGNILDVFFVEPRDYARDPEMTKLIDAGLQEFDDAKRAALYGKVFDLSNSESYIFPFTSIPTVYATTKDIELVPDRYAMGDIWATSYTYKK